MTETSDPREIAAAVRLGVGLLSRRVRQLAPGPDEEDLTIPENSALARLDRCGPVAAAELARQEQISPQSMGATLGVLQDRGFIERARDPEDGRRYVLTITAAGLDALRRRRSARTDAMARTLAEHFTAAELTALGRAMPLLERLAEKL